MCMLAEFYTRFLNLAENWARLDISTTSPVCLILKHRKMLHFGNQVEKDKHTVKQNWAESELFFHMSPWDIYYAYFLYKHSPLARNTVVPFFFFWWWEIVLLRRILPSSSNHLRTGNFQLAFQKLVAMTKSTIYSLLPYHSHDHRP